MSKDLTFRREAIDEAVAARRWYAGQRREAAEGFLRELRAADDAIADGPSRYPFCEPPYRFCRLKRYPYLVIYRELADGVEVLVMCYSFIAG